MAIPYSPEFYARFDQLFCSTLPLQTIHDQLHHEFPDELAKHPGIQVHSWQSLATRRGLHRPKPQAAQADLPLSKEVEVKEAPPVVLAPKNPKVDINEFTVFGKTIPLEFVNRLIEEADGNPARTLAREVNILAAEFSLEQSEKFNVALRRFFDTELKYRYPDIAANKGAVQVNLQKALRKELIQRLHKAKWRPQSILERATEAFPNLPDLAPDEFVNIIRGTRAKRFKADGTPKPESKKVVVETVYTVSIDGPGLVFKSSTTLEKAQSALLALFAMENKHGTRDSGDGD